MSSLRPVGGTAREVLALLQEWNGPDAEPEHLMIDTSGSTGAPKRVVLSRTAMRASAIGTQTRLGGPGQWLLSLAPEYVAGVQVLFRSVIAGTEPVVQDGDFADAAAAMTGTRRYLSLVPTQLARMLDSGRDRDALRRFDTILVGGANFDPILRRAATEAGLTVVATYGMSETCGGCVYDGLPLDGVAVAVGNDSRVRIRGPVVFEEYDAEPARTAAAKQDGWFLTSDLGRLDLNGRLEVLGRADDVVISGGVNVPVPAVAARLREHANVQAAEVVGVPDGEWGQRVVAVVVGDLALAQARDWVSAVHPRIWAPREVVNVTTIPLLDNGKVDRMKLQELAARA